MKFGYQFTRTTIQIIQDSNFRGKLSFTDLPSFLQQPPRVGSQASGYTKRHEYQNDDGLYIQDSFRWTPHLTVNLGLRWDYFGVVGENNDFFYQLQARHGGRWSKSVGRAAVKALSTRLEELRAARRASRGT